MMKWLRKYRKQLMVGLVMFAMLSFVGGSAIETMFNPDLGAVVFAEIFGASVTKNDLDRAQADIQILETIAGYNLPYLIDPRVLPDIELRHYFMLIREAERAEIVIPDSSADAWLESLGISSEVLQAKFSQQRSFTYPSVRNAFRRLMAVQSLARPVASAATPSEAEIRHYVRDTGDKIEVQLAVLDARRFVDNAEPVTLEEARAHFEKYKNESAAESDSGFGYKYPRRVRVQYFGADYSAVAPQIQLNDDEVKASWRKTRTQYRITETVEVPIPAAPQPTTASSQPTSQPAIQPATRTEQREREKLFSEARPQVERALRARKAQARVETAMRAAARALLQPWAGQSINPKTGYKEDIPQVVKDPAYMRRIRDEVSERYGVALRFEETGLNTLEELGRLPRISFASATISRNEQLRFPEYAFRNKKFFEKEAGSETTLSLQLYQTPSAPLVSSFGLLISGPFSQPTGLYLFRVVEARESEPPASLEAVRTQVDDDIRTARAYERIAPQARELYAIASKLGIGVALNMMDDLRTKAGLSAPQRAGPFSRRTPPLLAVTNVPVLRAKSETFIDACFAMAAEDWAPPAIEFPDTPKTQAATSRPARTPPPKVDLVGLPKLQKWVVMEFAKYTPVDSDRYQNLLRAQALNALRLQRQTVLLETWFDPKNIEKRCGYREIAPDTADDEDAAG